MFCFTSLANNHIKCNKMKSVVKAISMISFLFFACTKDSINTKPSVTLQSFTPNIIPINGTATVTFSFGDKEADLDSIYIFKKRLNKKTTATNRDTLKFGIPYFDRSTTGEISVLMGYQSELISAISPTQSGTPPSRDPDTLQFKFVVKDKAKNNSDTIIASPIIVIR